jgi:tRNA threonylcarbamoyladenosine biosynthesis protein TsaE
MPSIISHSEQDTKKYAKNLFKTLNKPVCICLYGELGSGKTVFVKGFAAALGIEEKRIKSPTYTYLRQYRIGKRLFYHFDFYRINELDDLIGQELIELFADPKAYFIIEWPERIAPILPENRIDIRIDYLNQTERKISIGHE